MFRELLPTHPARPCNSKLQPGQLFADPQHCQLTHPPVPGCEHSTSCSPSSLPGRLQSILGNSPARSSFHNQSSEQTPAEKPLGPLWSRAQPISRAPVGALNQSRDQPPPASGAHEEEPLQQPLQTTPPKHKEPVGARQGPGARHPAPHRLRHPPPFPFPTPVPCAHVAPCLVPPYPLTFLLSP